MQKVNQSRSKAKNHKSLAAKLFILIFAGAFFYSPAKITLAQSYSGAENSYTIKLLNASDIATLNQVGDSINLIFADSKAAQFQNVYDFKSHFPLSALQNYLAGKFVYLEADRQLSVAQIFSNDPGYTSNPLDIDKQWDLVKAGFTDAWQKTTGDKSNVVAIIDTGIDATHEDLHAINYINGFDFTRNQPITAGSNSDDNGHGTLVAGILGATANNGVGIVGTNWQISVIPIKALDAAGKGDAATVAEAIVWATDHGAQFLNLSLGGIGFGHDTALADAVSYAFGKNVLMVAAAGNDGATVGASLDQSPVFPICDDNNYNMILGVTSTDQNDLKPDFANYGRNCVDVAAPGKRILSTISFDPLTKRPAANSYAYASGTSLGVPLVVGQAALIKALYPQATNIQIRDRIISTADPIDSLNLSQCGGASCSGLIGAGRIDVPKSLAQAITPAFQEGDLIKVLDTGASYQIVGGQKRLISPFVLNQRFSGATFKQASSITQLSGFPDGPYVTPLDGTLVKLDGDTTVYAIGNGQKMPVTGQVFKQRNLDFSQVNTLSYSEVNSWPTGSFYPPVEGTLVRGFKGLTVYWVVSQTLHPINFNFFVDRGLNIFPIMLVPDLDINSYAKGDAFIR